jgi:hypothetical protein
MSFCGTIELERRWKMFNFAMHCDGLAFRLFHLKHDRTKLDENGQAQLFQTALKDREDFAKFAANLRFFSEVWTNERSEEYWKEYGKHEYTDYEFHELFNDVLREKTGFIIPILEKVGNGEQLTDEETKSAMDFLHGLSARAHAKIDRGGCF